MGGGLGDIILGSQPSFINCEGFGFANDDGTFDYVLQFADIARPVVTLEPLDVAASQFSRREV